MLESDHHMRDEQEGHEKSKGKEVANAKGLFPSPKVCYLQITDSGAALWTAPHSARIGEKRPSHREPAPESRVRSQPWALSK